MDEDNRTDEQIQAEKNRPTPGQGLVLVGFGKYNLKEMLLWQDTPQEEKLVTAFKRWPPVYRREEICSQDDLTAACQYLVYLNDVILEWELNNPSTNKENNNE